jgi:hypothetical protein
MFRTLSLTALCFVLPGCVAAIGNTGYQDAKYDKQDRPLLEERVAAAQRIVDLRSANLENLRTLHQAGRGDASALMQAEIELEQAKLVLLDCKAALQAANRAAKKND